MGAFHVKHPIWVDVAGNTGRPLDRRQIELLSRYREWLGDEAVVSGGIGPGEVDRLDTRHIADSLFFATVFEEDPPEIWDLGSGVGLPGIPLAILLPKSKVRLIDRSGRRVELAERAVRILGIDNVEVEQTEIEALESPIPVIVSRASLSPKLMAEIATKTLVPGGLAVLGGSWERKPQHPKWKTVEISPDPLDHPVWLLMMRRQ